MRFQTGTLAMACAFSNHYVRRTGWLPMGHVRHNSALHRFEMDVEGGMAFASYWLADDVMTFTHTEVPFALRGRGVGSHMMRAVLQNVRAQGVKVVPRCPFVADFIDKHPEYADLLA